MAPGPLHGLLVADFSRVLAGPLCAMTLGDLGADVVKVERPDRGDDTRAWGPYTPDGTSTYYLALNRNKRSVTLDLADAGDLALAHELAARADVVVSSFRPGLMERFGLDQAAITVRGNPGVVTCEISAFGEGEDARELPGYDLLLQAMSGVMSATGEADRPPVRVGVAVVDIISGLNAAIAVQAALGARAAAGGRGQRVRVSLMDSGLAALVNLAGGYLNAGVVPARMGTGHPSLTPYQTVRAADREFCLTVGNDRQFRRLCEVLDRPELAGDERFASNPARLAHRALLLAELGVTLAQRDAARWIALLGEAGVPAGPVNDVAEAFALAARLGLDSVDETAGVRTVRSPLVLQDTPASVRLPPPALGEHDAQVRAWLAQPR